MRTASYRAEWRERPMSLPARSEKAAAAIVVSNLSQRLRPLLPLPLGPRGRGQG